ncbi:MAG TPA: hypothetical protein VKU40_07715 [Thermoanaerobaculia bacterium]|nr:hypothetical protein [Thermoanaerobaculia bacterium]
MKRTVLFTVFTVALLLVAAPISACDQVCHFSPAPWGETIALCLTIPDDDGHTLCIEFNYRGWGSCMLRGRCIDGFVVPRT